MPPLPQPHSGQPLLIKNRPLEFSFWPMERTTRRFGLGTRVFATDPWTVIRRSAERRCLAAARPAAFALLEQAEDYFRAADSGVKAAKPLLLYYCFMNLAKAFILTARQRDAVNNAQHGLAEKLDAAPNDQELINAWLQSHRTLSFGTVPGPNQTINIFDELLHALSGTQIPAAHFRFDLMKLLPQVIAGHRLWVEADGDRNAERFVSVEKVELWQNQAAKTIWLRMYLFKDDLRRLNVGHQEILDRAQLAGSFREVRCSDTRDGRSLLCFEQIAAMNYGHRPSDEVPTVVEAVKHRLWRTVLITPPYRKYYLYAAPQTEHAQVLPQILSIYGITYYLGSIVRYRPHHFDRILAAHYGPFIEAFLNDQPSQFLYLMASEFAEKEVTRAAIV